MLHIKNINCTTMFKVQTLPQHSHIDRCSSCLVPKVLNKKKKTTFDEQTMNDILARLLSIASKFTSSRYILSWNMDNLEKDLRQWVVKACS